MDDIIFVLTMMWTVPLALIGVAKLVDLAYATSMVGKGYIRAMLYGLNTRGQKYWVKPSRKEVKIGGRTFPYDDSPEFLVLFSSFLGTIPTAAFDLRTGRQVRLRDDPTAKGKDAEVIQGMGKMAYGKGYSDGLGAATNLRIWFIVIILLQLGLWAASNFMPK